MILGGSNNIIEMCRFEYNQDTGLQVSQSGGDWPTNNLIKNCTSCNNCDDATMENADGFAAKLTCGEGNVFDGCIAYNNSDDGWDLFAKTTTGPSGVVTLRNCVSFRNGYTEDGKKLHRKERTVLSRFRQVQAAGQSSTVFLRRKTAIMTVCQTTGSRHMV